MKKNQLFILLMCLSSYSYLAFSQNFITTWQTDNPGTSTGTSITIPTFPGETYNYDVDWNNDGVFDEFGISGDITHDFGFTGIYTISIQGFFPRIYFNDGGDKEKLISIEQWGTQQWTSMEGAFYGCRNLQINAIDVPDLSNVTSMRLMFAFARFFDSDISNWDVSTITNMTAMFGNAAFFNQDISSWDVSNVLDMTAMFSDADYFDQDISSWDVGNVQNMTGMFYGSNGFNQDIGNWDTSSVTNMSQMFQSATVFNQNIGSWNTSGVIDMSAMFYNARRFNQDISGWDVSNVVNMNHMFERANDFNQDISNWDTSSVTDMSFMFRGARAFNQNIGNWDINNVANLESMFRSTRDFNQGLNNWDTSNVTNMESMFYNARRFNQDIGNWNTSNVTDMSSMFRGAFDFNQDIGSWNTRSVIDMSSMFYSAYDFNQDIGDWNVTSVTNMSNMFRNIRLSTENYDSILIGWNSQVLHDNVNFHGGNSTYCEGETARDNMIASNNWTIADGGLEGPNCSMKKFGISAASKSIKNKEANGFKLHPNPAHDILFIEGLEKGSHIDIIDVTGKVMITSTTDSAIHGINISTLSSGIYFIKLPAKDSFLIKKLIKK